MPKRISPPNYCPPGLGVVSTRDIRVTERGAGTTRDQRALLFDEGTGPSGCYQYVTRTVKALRPLADGTWEHYTYQETVKVPYLKPRAATVRAPRVTEVADEGHRVTKADHARIMAGIDSGHNFNEQ